LCQGFQTKCCKHFLSPPCLAHLILVNFFLVVISQEEYESWLFLLLYRPVTSSLLDPETLLRPSFAPIHTTDETIYYGIISVSVINLTLIKGL
jgi:hypothetical protein